MEDEHGVQGAKFGACGAEVETDDHGVEDDAELEDEESCDLLAEGALFLVDGGDGLPGCLLRIGVEVWFGGGLVFEDLRLGDGVVEGFVLIAAV